MSRMNQDNNQKKDKEMNEEMTQQLMDQATELVRTLADALSLTCGYTDDGLEERINEYVDDALEVADIDQKVADAICNSDAILNEDNVRDTAVEVVRDYDWNEVIQSNDVATENWVEERIDGLLDDKMFTYVQDFMMRFFKSETDRWLDNVRDHAITEHTIKKQKEEKQEEPVAVQE